MTDEFAKTVNRIISDMYQAISNVNTTVLLIDSSGTINCIWRNLSSLEQYMLNAAVGEEIFKCEPSSRILMRAITSECFVEDIVKINSGESMAILGISIHVEDTEDLGGLGVFMPFERENIDSARGLIKITAATLEGQWRAIYHKRNYEQLYRNFSGVMGTLSAGIVVTDKNLAVAHINDAAVKLLRLEHRELIGENIDLCLHSGGMFLHILQNLQDNVGTKRNVQLEGTDIECEIYPIYKGAAEEDCEGLIIKLNPPRHLKLDKRSKRHMGVHFHFGDIHGKSKGIQEAIRLGKIASESLSNVLILGESGTGKELFAQAIHNYSVRREGPFVTVNCGALREELVEYELLGCEERMPGGADIMGKQGKFEQANGGTLFLDEIGDMSADSQAILLRVLQNQEIVRTGGSKKIKVNVRIIAATNRNMEQLVQEHKFRGDLYYRLNVFTLNLPSLADRKEDILLLSDYFIKNYSEDLGKPAKRLSSDVAKLLFDYDWPGNIRELKNVIQRAVNISRENVILPEDLPLNLQSFKAGKSQTGMSKTKVIPKISSLNKVQQLEKNAIVEALNKCNGNISKTAEFLGLNRRTLYRRMDNYGIDAKQYKP